MNGPPTTLPDGSPVGWYVTDPDGNVVDYGGTSVLEIVSAAGEGA